MGPWRWLAANRQLDRLANSRQPPLEHRSGSGPSWRSTDTRVSFQHILWNGGASSEAPPFRVDPERAGAQRRRDQGAGPRPALVLCHGFPAGPGGALTSAQTYPDLADHLAAETGWTVIAFNFRGAGESEGNFSLLGWLDDLVAVVDHAVDLPRVGGVWVAGSSAGGAVALCVAAEDDRIRGVATLAAPAEFDNWASDARAFLSHCRQVGVVRDAAFPPDVEAWASEFKKVQPLTGAAGV